MQFLKPKFLVTVVCCAFLIKISWSIVALVTFEVGDDLESAPPVKTKTPRSYSSVSETPAENAARPKIKKESLTDEIVTLAENNSDEEFVIDRSGNKLYAVEIEGIGKQFLSEETRNDYYKYKQHKEEFNKSLIGALDNFYNYEFNADMSHKMELALHEKFLVDINGNQSFPDIIVEDLECRGTVCKLSFSSTNESTKMIQMAKLSQSLSNLGNGGRENFGRSYIQDTNDNNYYTYYVSGSIYD